MSTASKLAYLGETKSLIKQAIIDKGVEVADTDTFRSYATHIGNINVSTAPTYTGHVDSAGLASIGWTDDDIAYYQAHVTWNEEYDQYHLVSDYDKQIWQDYQDGTFVLPTVFSNANKIYTYYPYIEHCPKFDTSNVTNGSFVFSNCYNLVAVPTIDVSSVTTLYQAFQACYSLTSLDVSNWDVSSVTTLYQAFYACYSLTNVVGVLDLNVTSTITNAFYRMYSLKTIKFENIGVSFALDNSPLLSYESIIYIIEHAKTVTDQTMTLGEINLAKLTDDEIAVAIGKGWTLV